VKILGVIENDVSAGGGYFQGLNAILQMNDICNNNNIQFEVATISEKSIYFFKQKKIEAFCYKLSVFDKIIHKVLSNSLVKFGFDYLGLNLLYPIERKLKQANPDLLYFIQPSSIPLYIKNINFIYTVWDLCHRDFPEFPEVRNNNIFRNREYKYKMILPESSLIIVDSDITAEKISNYYGINSDRMLVMPFSPNPFIKEISKDKLLDGLNVMNITGSYLFYPAQFWPHKNHIGLLKSIIILRERGHDINLILVGGDKGNKDFIAKFINENNLSNQVKIFGFVSSDELNVLYSGCSSVIMPTFFGPTNLPPLEAWTYNLSLIHI
jgi:glycosyltransferase involved in cell wall biosynthesis